MADRFTKAAGAVLRCDEVAVVLGGGCWAMIYQRGNRQLIPQAVHCGRLRGRGYLTCHTHRDREDAAQELKAAKAVDLGRAAQPDRRKWFSPPVRR